MYFFKIKVIIKHKKFESIKSTLYIKRKKIPILLQRMEDKNNFIFYIKYYDLNKKDIIQILNFYNIEYNPSNISIQELNKYVQNKNIRFR